MKLDINRFVLAVAETAFVFGLIIFIYVAVIGVTHPEWLDDPLTHHAWLSSMRTDNIGLLAFVGSFLGLLAFRYWKDR